MDLNSHERAVQSLDYSGSVVAVSPGWLELTGYTEEEVIGRFFLEFLDFESLKKAQTCFPHLKDYGYVDDVPLKIRAKNNSILSVRLTGTSKYHDDGRFERTYCVMAPNPSFDDF
jgi:PAS domain S-box-containing protein